MTITETDRPQPISWDAPDKGVWSCETAHSQSVAPVPMRQHVERAFEAGFRSSFAGLGVPLSHVEVRHINGWPYVSFFMHDIPRGAGKPPPTFVLKAITRLHPGFRKRTKVAAAAIAEGRPLQFAQQWEAERASWIARNLELQRVDAEHLDDRQLAEHLARVTDACEAGQRRHFELVAGCIPLGAWLARCGEWGLPRDATRQAVMHSTPVHIEAAARLARIAAALDGAVASDLGAVRNHSSEAAAALDDYLEHHGWWSTEDTLNATRVIDHPGIVLASIRAHRTVSSAAADQDPEAILAELRERVPVTDRAEFDRLATDAHRTHRMLDDNSGILASWLGGIAGEAYRCVGRRLVERGRIRSADDIWALELDDISALLEGRPTPSIADVDSMVAKLRSEGELSPPPHLNGEPSPPPDPSVFPGPVAELMTGLGAFLNDKFNDAHETSGIGTRTVQGRARRGAQPERRLRPPRARGHPGDFSNDPRLQLGVADRGWAGRHGRRSELPCSDYRQRTRPPDHRGIRRCTDHDPRRGDDLARPPQRESHDPRRRLSRRSVRPVGVSRLRAS